MRKSKEKTKHGHVDTIQVVVNAWQWPMGTQTPAARRKRRGGGGRIEHQGSLALLATGVQQTDE